jgi:hypothetical protein
MCDVTLLSDGNDHLVVTVVGSDRRQQAPVLSPAATDAVHPDFSNPFVETEVTEMLSASQASRRPSGAPNSRPRQIHAVMVPGAEAPLPCETDPMRSSRPTQAASPIGEGPGTPGVVGDAPRVRRARREEGRG